MPPNSLARHPTIAAAARLAGHRGASAFGEFAARLDGAPRVERGRAVPETGERARETARGPTSPGAGQAGPGELPDIVRRRNAAVSIVRRRNAAVSIVRATGRFDRLPRANRHHAAAPDRPATPPLRQRVPDGPIGPRHRENRTATFEQARGRGGRS